MEGNLKNRALKLQTALQAPKGEWSIVRTLKPTNNGKGAGFRIAALPYV